MNIVASLLLLLSALTYAVSNDPVEPDPLKAFLYSLFGSLFGTSSAEEDMFPIFSALWSTSSDIDMIDECASNPCQNGALCSVSEGGYYCDCQNGFEGKNCDEIGYSSINGHIAGPDTCGYIDGPIGTRIVGGTRAQNGSWPWMAMLAYAGGPHFCGGTVIKKAWVLTAAHCVDGLSPSQIVVRMGAYKITDIAQERQVEKILIHEKYNTVTLVHDIALIKLKANISLASSYNITPACLPDKSDFYPTSMNCYVMGWGTLSHGGSQPDYLQEAPVQALSNAECMESYGADRIAETMICATNAGVDACQGDSGGPLMCDEFGKYSLGGIVSWGYECALPDYPGVYTRVSSYIDWVMEYVKDNL